MAEHMGAINNWYDLSRWKYMSDLFDIFGIDKDSFYLNGTVLVLISKNSYITDKLRVLYIYGLIDSKRYRHTADSIEISHVDSRLFAYDNGRGTSDFTSIRRVVPTNLKNSIEYREKIYANLQRLGFTFDHSNLPYMVNDIFIDNIVSVSNINTPSYLKKHLKLQKRIDAEELEIIEKYYDYSDEELELLIRMG